MIIDTHVHLGDIYANPSTILLEERTPETTYPFKKNTYECMGYKNIYLGKINYLTKPLIVSSAGDMTKYSNVPNLLDSMKKFGISKSVVLPIEPHVSTDSILEICKKNQDLIPFCSVHPHDKDKKAKLKRYIDAGCKGLKIHPVIQQVAPDDPATLELLEEFSQYNKPVLFHTGWGSIGIGSYGFTRHYLKILRDFPKIKFIFAHMGFYEPGSMLKAIKGHKNIWVDVSWQPPGIIKKAINMLGSDRIMYGSDWPYNLQGTSIDFVMKAANGNSSITDKVLYKNAEDLILS